MTGEGGSCDIEDEEPQPLEYARHNGLSCDYFQCNGSAELETLQERVDLVITDDSHLPQFDLGPEMIVQERLSLSRNAAKLLASISREESPESIDTITKKLLEQKGGVQKLKVELPLLRTDHETDCGEFGRKDNFEIKLQDIRLPLEIVNEDNCEGLNWPEKMWKMGAEIIEGLKTEKIQTTRDTLVYLQSALKVDWTPEDEQLLWGGQEPYRRNKAIQSVTPPLSPLPVRPQPYEPGSSDSDFDLPLLSDPTSPTRQELEYLEKHFFEQDAPSPYRELMAKQKSEQSTSDTYVDDNTFALGDIDPTLVFMDEDDPPDIENPRTRAKDLKVEGPLTPEMPTSGLPKTVRFSDVIEEMLLPGSSTPMNPTMQNKFLVETCAPAAKEVNQRLEQEKLIRADALSRVDEPLMDFTQPSPPWKYFEQQLDPKSLLALQKSFMGDIIGESMLEWPVTKKKRHSLKWIPFPPELGTVTLEEKDCPFLDEVAWQVFVNESEEAIDSSALTWKPPGLKILRDDGDDDEEIGFGSFRKPQTHDISFLVKKRKMEMEKSEEIQREAVAMIKLHPALDGGLLGISKPKRSDFVTAAEKMEGDKPYKEVPGILGGGPFSAMASLGNYLEIRGAKKQKLSDSNYFSTASINQPEKHPDMPKLPAKSPTYPEPVMQLPVGESSLAKGAPLPTPNLQKFQERICVIASSVLFKNQKCLIKALKANIPSIDFIDRDWTAHNTTAWMPGSVARSPIKSALDSEADIIVSPMTGIILTTLQKIKQKPLPGDKGRAPFLDTLQKISLRYERLIIFVSEGRKDEHSDSLDDSDCLALAEFVGFTLGLDTTITVQFVGGGDETLAKWVAATVMQNCNGKEADLLDEETHWELFLRRAGVNAFAAQRIIVELKAPAGVDSTCPSKAGQFGLTGFVEMGRQQRIARLTWVCGRRVLERVSDVVDGIWQEGMI